MKWRIQRVMTAPFSSLPCQQVAYPATLETRLVLNSRIEDQPDALNVWLQTLSADPVFCIKATTHWQPEHLPSPWQQIEWQDAEADRQTALKSHLLAELLLLTPEQIKQAQLDASKACQWVSEFCQQPRAQDLFREALFFAFFNRPHLFERQGILEHWLKDIKDVYYERGTLARTRQTKSPLIQMGYALLQRIQQLREDKQSADTLIEQWQQFEASCQKPLPCTSQIVFWSEAAYCLTEQGDRQGAETMLHRQAEAINRLAQHLPGLQKDELIGNMWHHHLGRLAYYYGDMDRALFLFSKEWQNYDQLDSANRSRLERSCANVLTDLGFLTEAEQLICKTRTNQEYTDEPELFKSYGRLGEVLLRLGRYDEAEHAYLKSLALQASDHNSQTHIYLGHTYSLSGKFKHAEDCYQKAQALDDMHHPQAFNAYLGMGLASLYYKTGRHADLERFWANRQQQIKALKGGLVLPKSVMMIAAWQQKRIDTQQLETVFQELLEDRYYLEACYLLPLLYPTPEAGRNTLTVILTQLTQWHDAGKMFCQQAKLKTETNDRAVFRLHNSLATLEKAQQQNDWQPIRFWLQQLYPFKLLNNAT